MKIRWYWFRWGFVPFTRAIYFSKRQPMFLAVIFFRGLFYSPKANARGPFKVPYMLGPQPEHCSRCGSHAGIDYVGCIENTYIYIYTPGSSNKSTLLRVAFVMFVACTHLGGHSGQCPEVQLVVFLRVLMSPGGKALRTIPGHQREILGHLREIRRNLQDIGGHLRSHQHRVPVFLWLGTTTKRQDWT